LKVDQIFFIKIKINFRNIYLADPTTILSCVAIDAIGLVQATKGNIRAFCTMAERFMECLKTKTRGCFGEDVRK